MVFVPPSPETPFDKILDALGDRVVKRDGRDLQARCPAHDDRHPSLSVTEAEDGRILVHCHAGCSIEDVLGAIGLSLKDLFPATSGSSSTRKKSGKIVKTYDYSDDRGDLLFQVVRTEPKDFFFRRPNGRGGWINDIRGVQRVLYRLPVLVKSDRAEWVYVVEGEKDADRLTDVGLIATTSPGGAEKWGKVDDSPLQDRKVAILADNDDAGKKHAEQVAQSLWGKAADIRIVELPNLPDGGDVSDFLDAGGNIEQLSALVEATPAWWPERERSGPEDEAHGTDDTAKDNPIIASPFCNEEAASVWALARERFSERSREDRAVAGFLHDYGIVASADYGLLDADMSLPKEVRWWPKASYRLILPLYSPDGELVNIQGLAIDPLQDPSTRVPKGSKVAGLIVANATGVELLRGCAQPNLVIIVDGLLEFLALSAVAPSFRLFAVAHSRLAPGAIGPWVEGLPVLFVSATFDEEATMSVARQVDRHGGTMLRLQAQPSDCVVDVLCEALNDETPERFLAKITAGDGSHGPTAEQIVLPPKIVQNYRQFDTVFAEGWSALFRTNNPPHFYCRTGSLVELRREDGPAEFHHFKPEGFDLLPLLAKVADWKKIMAKVYVDVAPDMKIVKSMIAAPHNDLPKVDSIMRTQFFSVDGGLVATPGYHESARVILDGHGLPEIGNVPNEPTRVEVEEAASFIQAELLGDFPFATDADKAHAFAALLQPFIRLLIGDPTPLYIIESPTPGTGKTLLADIISIVATGRPVLTQALPQKEEEVEKRITSILIDSPSLVLLDNANRRIDSPSLCAVLTTVNYSGRYLGHSRMLKLKNYAEWLITANNPETSLEIARRAVRIRLDAMVEQPWLREGFRHPNLLRWAKDNRGELIRCFLVVVQNWIASGRPAGPHKPPGSFESWGETMDGILAAAGVPGFLENLESGYRSAGAETEDWLPFLSAWWAQYGNQSVTVRSLVELCEREPALNGLVYGRTERAQATRLGRRLRRMREQVVGEFRIELAQDDRHKGRQYRLQRLENPDGGLQGDMRGTSGNEKSPAISPHMKGTCRREGDLGDFEATSRPSTRDDNDDDDTDAASELRKRRPEHSHSTAGSKKVPQVPPGSVTQETNVTSGGGPLDFRSPPEVPPKSPRLSNDDGLADLRDIVGADS